MGRIKRFAQGGTILAGAAAYDPELAFYAEQMNLQGDYIQSTAPQTRPQAYVPKAPSGRTFDQITGNAYLSDAERKWYLDEQARRAAASGNTAEAQRLRSLTAPPQQLKQPQLPAAPTQHSLGMAQNLATQRAGRAALELQFDQAAQTGIEAPEYAQSLIDRRNRTIGLANQMQMLEGADTPYAGNYVKAVNDLRDRMRQDAAILNQPNLSAFAEDRLRERQRQNMAMLDAVNGVYRPSLLERLGGVVQDVEGAFKAADLPSFNLPLGTPTGIMGPTRKARVNPPSAYDLLLNRNDAVVNAAGDVGAFLGRPVGLEGVGRFIGENFVPASGAELLLAPTGLGLAGDVTDVARLGRAIGGGIARPIQRYGIPAARRAGPALDLASRWVTPRMGIETPRDRMGDILNEVKQTAPRDRITVNVDDLTTRPDLFQARDYDPGSATSQTRVNQIVEGWDPAQFEAPVVVPDPENPGKYIITRGHHRTEAWRQVHGPGSQIDVVVAPVDIRDPAALRSLALEGDASNFTTAIPNTREAIRAIDRASAAGLDDAQIAKNLRLRASQLDAYRDIARLGDNVVDRVVTEPGLEGLAAELGRGMRAYGVSQEDAAGWFSRLANATRGERPTISALRTTVDRFGSQLAKQAAPAQVDMFGNAQQAFEGTRGGILEMLDANTKIRTNLEKEVRKVRRLQRQVAELGAGASAADESSFTAVLAAAQRRQADLEEQIARSNEDVMAAFRGPETPTPRAGGETVKRADLFGNVDDTYATEAELAGIRQTQGQLPPTTPAPESAAPDDMTAQLAEMERRLTAGEELPSTPASKSLADMKADLAVFNRSIAGTPAQVRDRWRSLQAELDPGSVDEAARRNSAARRAYEAALEATGDPEAARLAARGAAFGQQEQEAAHAAAGSIIHPDGREIPATPENIEAAVRRALTPKTGPTGPDDVDPGELSINLDPQPGITEDEVGDKLMDAITDIVMGARTGTGRPLLDGVPAEDIDEVVEDLIDDIEVIVAPGGPDGTTPVVRVRMQPGEQPARNLSIGSTSDIDAKLPRDLEKADPRYNYGKKKFTLSFANDIDRAAYITAQATRSKRDADYLAFVMENTGLSENEVRAMGASLKNRIKQMAKDAPDGVMRVPPGRVVDPDAPAQGLSGPRLDRPVNEYGMEQGLPTAPRTIEPDPEVAARREQLRAEREAGARAWADAEEARLRSIMAGEGAAPPAPPPSAVGGGIGGGEPPSLPSGRTPGGSEGRKPSLPRRIRRQLGRTFKMGRRPESFNLWHEIVGIIGLPQTLLTMLDASFFGRQGAVLGWAHPQDWRRMLVDGLKAVSEDQADRIARTLRESFWYSTENGATRGFGAHDAGIEVGGRVRKENVHLYEWGPDVPQGERVPGFTGLSDSYVSRGAAASPGVGTSQRMFATGLNSQAMSAWERVAREQAKHGFGDARDAKFLDAYAKVINHARGYGGFDIFHLLPGLNALFSGRNTVSRFQVLLDPFMQPGALWKASPRRMAAENLAGFIGGNMAILGLLAATSSYAGGLWDVNFDPRSGDWGKIRIGNTTVDPWAGFGPIVRLVVRSAMGEGKTQAGDLYDTDVKREFLNFFRNKSAPVPSLMIEMLTGEDYLGNKSPLADGISFGDFMDRASEMLIPFIVQDVVEAYMENEGGMRLPAAVAAGVGSFFGGGAQSYPPSNEQQLSEALSDVPESMRTDSSGKVIDRWNQLTSVQQREIVEKYGGIFADLEAPGADERVTPSEEIEILTAEKRLEAWEAFQANGDGEAYRQAMTEIGKESRIRFDQEYGDEEDRPERSEDRQLIADFFDALDAAGDDYDERDRLETRFRAELSPAQNQVIDDALMTSADPNYEKLKAARQYIDENYWKQRDEGYARLVANAQPGSPASRYRTYDDLVKAANDRTVEGAARREEAKAMLSHVQGLLSDQSLAARYQDTQLDALLFIYGYTDSVLTPAAQDLVENWARTNGVDLAEAPGRVPR